MQKIIESLKNYKKTIILVCILLCIPLVYSFSKYAINQISEHYFKSKGFYFYSPLLDGRTHKLYGWDGNSNYTFYFDITNSLDDLNWTKEDIDYTITVTCSSPVGNITCTGGGDKTINYSNVGKTINSEEIVIQRGSLVFNTDDYINLNISVSSTAPYSKTLSGTYKIYVNEMGINYFIKDGINSDYAEFIISNNKNDRNITIEWDNDLLNIDHNNYFVNTSTKTTQTIGNVTYVSSVNFDVIKNNIYSIKFYKKSISEVYSLNNDVISLSTN